MRRLEISAIVFANFSSSAIRSRFCLGTANDRAVAYDVPQLPDIPSEIKTLPAYTLADAARYVGLSPNTLRAWFRGRPPHTTKQGAFRRAAVKSILATDAGPREPFSFIDLIEAHVLFSIRKTYKFPMQKVRTAMEYLSQHGGNLMFLAHEDFCHDRSDLFLGRDSTLLSLSERGQLVDRTIMESGLHQIEFGKDGYADKFFPKIGDIEQREFVVNPKINYGRISLARLGIGADVLAARYAAKENLADIVEDYGATPEEVVEAIRWHDRLAA